LTAEQHKRHNQTQKTAEDNY